MTHRLDTLSSRLLKLIVSSSEGLQFYQVYRKLYISISELARVSEYLEAEGLISVNKYTISPTQKGVEVAMRNAVGGQRDNREKAWKETPKQFVVNRLEINAPYAPSINRLKLNKKD